MPIPLFVPQMMRTMGMKERAVLNSIDNDREITRSTDGRFLYEYQKAVLLALKEIGRLTEMQCRHSEEKLKIQFHTFIKRRMENEKDRGKGEYD